MGTKPKALSRLDRVPSSTRADASARAVYESAVSARRRNREHLIQYAERCRLVIRREHISHTRASGLFLSHGGGMRRHTTRQDQRRRRSGAWMIHHGAHEVRVGKQSRRDGRVSMFSHLAQNICYSRTALNHQRPQRARSTHSSSSSCAATCCVTIRSSVLWRRVCMRDRRARVSILATCQKP